MDLHFMGCLQRLRTFIGVPFNVTSGYRCAKHNSDPRVCGAPGSFHLLGRAADVALDMQLVPRFKLIAHALEFGLNGIGVGETIIHLDDREKPTLWVYTDR